ncbi:GDSL-type esterase/lipase family protein [Methylobacterium sp. WSM2598]|uniref:GDSL-type esterase/lipase family protein n=1 Tax=Methylobacterium sp. WSM2598 TaxID=398261 RepID=UPI000362FA89|nr:GDSL-type esterase/lipase family protein [Methylobacterium sp. WSM2598]
MTRPLGLAPPVKPSALRRHARLAVRVPAAADLVLLGDSQAAGWPEAALPPRSFNFGLPGDRVETTRWRLRAVDLSGLRPRRALLWVGTNNLADGDPVAEIVAGLGLLAAELLALWPGARPILVTLPWRAPRAGRPDADRRALNRGIAGLARGCGADLLDAAALLGGEAEAAHTLAADRLHVAPEGYRRLGARLVGPGPS